MLQRIQKQVGLSDEEMFYLDNMRSKVRYNKLLLILGLISLGIGVSTMFMELNDAGMTFAVFLLVSLSFFSVSVYLHSKKAEKYVDALQKLVVLPLLSKDFEGVAYWAHEGVEKDVVKKSGLIRMGSNFQSKGLMLATYNGVSFIQSDVETVQVIKKGKTVKTIPIFKGRWIVVDYVKHFKGYHQIRENGFIANYKPNPLIGASAKKINLEDQDFNNRFTVYSDDEKEAFYLLTPHIMNKMLELSNAISGEVIFAFIDNRLTIAINNDEETFDVRGVIDESFVAKVKRNNSINKAIINNLKLDLDIFKPEQKGDSYNG